MRATSNTWPLDTKNVTNATEELKFSFDLNLNSHLWLTAITLEGTELDNTDIIFKVFYHE